jgi:hypothetical protein
MSWGSQLIVVSIRTFPGEQAAILDRDLFEAVQAKLDEHRNSHTTKRSRSEALLIGRIFDDRGHRMTPSHVSKARDQISRDCLVGPGGLEPPTRPL